MDALSSGKKKVIVATIVLSLLLNIVLVVSAVTFQSILPVKINRGSSPTTSLHEGVVPLPSVKKTKSEQAQVTKVIDGNTFVISGGKKVRMIGIDTPETVDPRKSVMCFGKEASDFSKQLLTGKTVRLEKDVSETDKYGRLLRYVYLDTTFVNKYLVEEGYAHTTSYPPDVKYQDLFQQAEKNAREQQKGLWSVCN